MKKIAVIGVILENPASCQRAFNDVVSAHQHMVKGRMGLPFAAEEMAVVSITVLGELDEINALTGKLGKIAHVTVKTAISGKDVSC